MREFTTATVTCSFSIFVPAFVLVSLRIFITVTVCHTNEMLIWPFLDSLSQKHTLMPLPIETRKYIGYSYKILFLFLNKCAIKNCMTMRKYMPQQKQVSN